MKNLKNILLIIILIILIVGCTENNNNEKKKTNQENENNIIPSDIEIFHPQGPINLGDGGFIIYDDLSEIVLQVVERLKTDDSKWYYHFFVYDKNGLIEYNDYWLSKNDNLPINITLQLSGEPPYFIWAIGSISVSFYLHGNFNNTSYQIMDELKTKTTNISLESSDGKPDLFYLELNEETVGWNFAGTYKSETDFIGNFSIIDPKKNVQIWGNYSKSYDDIFMNHGARFMIHGNWTFRLITYEVDGKIKFPFYTYEFDENTWVKYGFDFQ